MLNFSAMEKMDTLFVALLLFLSSVLPAPAQQTERIYYCSDGDSIVLSGDKSITPSEPTIERQLLQFTDDRHIRLVFKIPCEYPLKITVSTLSRKPRYSFLYDKDNDSITVPRDSLGGGLEISISPKDILPQDINGKYYGIVEAVLSDYFLERENVLSITY